MSRLVLALVLVLVLGDSIHAQGGANVQIGKIRIGYLSELDTGWLPVSFPLENLGGESSIQLVAKVTAGKTTLWTSEKTVALLPKSRKVETLYVRLDDTAQSVEAQVVVDGRAIRTDSVGVTRRTQRGQRREAPVALHALLVREGPHERSLLAWLDPPPGSLTNPNATNPSPVTLTDATVEPRELPDRPEGYDGVDVVLLSKTSSRSFDEQRTAALLAWLGDGGRVILLPGSDVGWFRDELVQRLLPPDAKLDQVDVSLAALTKIVGSNNWNTWGTGRQPPVPNARFYTIQTERHGVRIGSEKVMGKRVPYFTVFKYGRGDVVVAAVDLEGQPFSQAPKVPPELGRLLHAALDPVPERRRIADDERLGPWFEEALREGELPSPLLLIPVVLIYILCVGPVNHRLVRRASTPVISVVTIPVISIVFTVVCFFAGYVVRGTSTSLDRLTIVEVHPGQDTGRAFAGLRIRSASSTRYGVAADPALVSVRRGFNQEQAGEHATETTRVIQDGGRFAFPELPLNLWERAFFQARGPFPLGGAVTIEVAPRGCTIKNGTRHDLGPGVVFLPGTDGFKVPPVAAGAAVKLDGSDPASVKDRVEVLATVCQGELQLKVSPRSLETFLAHLRLETTYVAGFKTAPASLAVEGAKPDRDLAVLIVQGDDQARDEEVFKWATSIARERSQEDYEDALRMLATIRPASRWYRDAQSLRAFIATAKFVDSAQDAYDAGDLDKARAMVLDVLGLPELDRDSVREIRSRLDRWTSVASELEEGCAATNLTVADRHFRAVLDKEPNPNVFRTAASERLDAIAQLRGSDSATARDAASTAAFDGDVGRALVGFRCAQRARDGRTKLAELQEAVSAAEKQHRWTEKLEIRATGGSTAVPGPKPTALERAYLVETALLLREFLPLDDPRRDAAIKFLDERDKRKGK